MKNNNYLVILAGGVGSRFWPVSSEAKPKQFLDILNCGQTLLQMTANRFSELVDEQNVWVVTVPAYAEMVREQLPFVPEENIIAEPCNRGTAPCVCYVSWKLKKLNPRANVIVTPSDHIVLDAKALQVAVQDVLAFASETDAIVALGLKPLRPETSYGYLKADLAYSSSRKVNIYRVDGFKEKPSKEDAEDYVRMPNYFWNSGIIVWSVSTIVNAFRVYEPEISSVFEQMLPVYGTEEEKQWIDKQYLICPEVSLDRAIMEKAEELFVYPADFPWSDLNSWTALKSEVTKDKYGNALFGDHISMFDSFNCLVHAKGARRVVIQGLDGYVVAENDGELLICKLSEEDRIKLFRD